VIERNRSPIADRIRAQSRHGASNDATAHDLAPVGASYVKFYWRPRQQPPFTLHESAPRRYVDHRDLVAWSDADRDKPVLIGPGMPPITPPFGPCVRHGDFH
jgi:hypothetical protein